MTHNYVAGQNCTLAPKVGVCVSHSGIPMHSVCAQPSALPRHMQLLLPSFKLLFSGGRRLRAPWAPQDPSQDLVFGCFNLKTRVLGGGVSQRHPQAQHLCALP
jgi:hypothetical protein